MGIVRAKGGEVGGSVESNGRSVCVRVNGVILCKCQLELSVLNTSPYGAETQTHTHTKKCTSNLNLILLVLFVYLILFSRLFFWPSQTISHCEKWTKSEKNTHTHKFSHSAIESKQTREKNTSKRNVHEKCVPIFCVRSFAHFSVCHSFKFTF